MKKIICVISLLGCIVCGNAQPSSIFKSGEQATYKVLYHWHFVWLESGQVTFSVNQQNYQGIPSYCITGEGHSYPKYDWFYQVRDTFKSYVDTLGFTPLRFERYSNEGSNHIKNDNLFDWIHHKAYYYSKNRETNFKCDSVVLPKLTFDPLSAIYYTRALDLSKAKVNDTIPITMYLDDKIYHIHIKYLGKENQETTFGTFRCIKISVSLVSGTIFKAGQEMTVWVTDDANRLPVIIEAPIIIGTVRVELLSFLNLKHEMDSKVK